MAARPRAARQPRERKNRPKSGVEGDAENAKYHCEQRTDSNQHPSSSVEGYVEGVKCLDFHQGQFNSPSLQAIVCQSVLEKRFERS